MKTDSYLKRVWRLQLGTPPVDDLWQSKMGLLIPLAEIALRWLTILSLGDFIKNIFKAQRRPFFVRTTGTSETFIELYVFVITAGVTGLFFLCGQGVNWVARGGPGNLHSGISGIAA
ncbi:MAG: hypothetical protein HQ477_03690 [Chloroflexi bacterium]|nr:hypothetical protein [Chloroflexota bacterium]